MPIYEYKCQSCDQVFEKYQSMRDSDGKIKCPNCGSEKAERLLSLFSSNNQGKQSCNIQAPT